MTDRQVCLHGVAEAIKSLELLIEYVECNKRLEWCWGIDISACKSKLEFYQDSLVDVTTALGVIDSLQTLQPDNISPLIFNINCIRNSDIINVGGQKILSTNNNNMNIKTNASKIPEEVIDYCIDNKLTVAESLIQLIDKKFESVDQDLKSLKHDVTEALSGESKAVEDDVVVTNEDIAEIEDFLNNFDNNNS